MKKLKVEMVHDIVCSWCPIGYHNIQTAISNLNIEVDFKFIPYELNPEMPEKGETIASYFERHFGWNDQKLLEYQDALVKTALNAGVKIDFSKRLNYYNTKKAHKLMHWAERFNKQTDLNERLITAYMEEGQDISNTDILLDIAVQVGLDRVSTENALSSAQLAQELNRKIERRKAFKIQSIPAFVLDENTFISGSNSVEFFEKTLSAFIGQTAANKKLLLDV
jgi:predicted DsbA family dithiol-disulfide isomerase